MVGEVFMCHCVYVRVVTEFVWLLKFWVLKRVLLCEYRTILSLYSRSLTGRFSDLMIVTIFMVTENGILVFVEMV